MKNSDYWKKRFISLEDASNKDAVKYIKDLQEQFRQATNSIAMDIERWYWRLADNNDISYNAAKKLLKASELEEFKWTVEQYVQKGKQNAVDGLWMKQLENASAKVHISYLEAMKICIQQHAELLYTEFDGGITDFLKNVYTDMYYKTAFEIAKGTGICTRLQEIDKRKIDIVLKKTWASDGKDFSNRIWNEKEKLIKNLHHELAQNIIRGSSQDDAISNISKAMRVDKNKASRLVMTESAAIASAAQKECFAELDIEKYEIVATLDTHTSNVCRELDGKIFDMKDYNIGLTAPPFHPFCRTTTCPYFDDEFTQDEERAYRDKNGKTQYVKDMKYAEWYEKYVSH